jgi:hypothetical protein
MDTAFANGVLIGGDSSPRYFLKRRLILNQISGTVAAAKWLLQNAMAHA